MRIRLLIILMTLGSFDAAVAQGIQDDPRRRRVVLPSVRAATECIAREALNELGIERLTNPGQLRGALGPPMRRCADEVDDMIAVHDRTYYPGFGEAFFQGPYLQDIVRAVQKRIAPELARRAAEGTSPSTLPERQGFVVMTPPSDTPAKAAVDDQARKAAEERDKKEVDAMWDRARSGPAVTKATSNAFPAPQVNPPAHPEEPSGGATLLGGIVVLLLAVFGLREAARRRARQRRYDRLLEKYRDVAIVDRIVAGEMWQGMTGEMLVDAWGRPVDRDQEVYKTRTTEVWKYGQTGRNRFKNRVIVENGIVVGYKKK